MNDIDDMGPGLMYWMVRHMPSNLGVTLEVWEICMQSWLGISVVGWPYVG